MRQLLNRFVRPAVLKFLLPDNPVSRHFGWERGRPIDRYYIERFLAENSKAITGAVLESGDCFYTSEYGKNVSESVALVFQQTGQQNEIVGDLSIPESLPSDRFDCFISPQTFQYVDDVPKAVESVFQLLRPGGVFLGTMPAVSQRSTGKGETWNDQWRFNRFCLERLFNNVFGKENTEVKAFGNVRVAASFLYGLTVKDLGSAVLDKSDPDYEFLITVYARKS